MQPPMVSQTTIVYIFLGIFVACLIGAISYVSYKSTQMATPSNVDRIKKIQGPLFEKGLLPYYKNKKSLREIAVPKNQQLLVNFAPLTVAIPGFLGPSVNGVFQERDATIAALKTGARCLVLPIDFHEDANLQPPLYSKVKEPCLLYRDVAGNVRSLNSGSIEKVAQAIADVAWSNLVFQKNDPLILILYLKRTPQPNTKEYVRYCSQIAKQLNPLMPYLLTQSPTGSYTRQGKQDTLLYDDLATFEKKLLIFCNADLKIFRDTRSVGITSVPPAEDLDFWTHLRIYKSAETDFGATGLVEQSVIPRSVIDTQESYTIIPDNRVADVVNTGKMRWNIGWNVKQENPTVDATKKMMSTFGVQCIPLQFNDINDETKKVMNLWKDSAWILKPEAIRFTKPDNFKPADPSPKLNANQGVISSPTV